ncbi:hypothetical protein CF394_04685 [Tetzosporium hominis]|uniref:Uncharacterized protein n=1 Tax=Tetzosporium hominis TaxID=2020506 RepID=A0A264W732_9BACL|nr:hypothetical protein [Tetzosporium hominis]OZS78837.1 hypothetical protein CF394_04685 [Tetzosporium hominis]
MRYILASLTICLLCYAVQVDLSKTPETTLCDPLSEYSLEIASPAGSLEEVYATSNAPISFLEWTHLLNQLNPNERNFSNRSFV